MKARIAGAHVALAALIVAGAGTRTINAQDNPAPIQAEELRAALLDLAELAGQMGVPSQQLHQEISDLSLQDMMALNQVFPDTRRFAEQVEILKTQRQFLAAVSSTRAQLHHRQPDRQAMGVVGILPGIDPFPPNYPSSALLDFLEGLIDAVPGVDVDFTDEKERCTDDVILALTIAQTAAQIAATIAQTACDTVVVVLGEGTTAPACIAAGVANGIKDVAQFGLDACAEQQKGVDSAEIEAAYENSLIIIEGLRCVVVDQQRMHHGCNGEDDDCDGIIDECDEDTFGPTVHIEQSVTNQCYDSDTDALAAIAAAVDAFDDCGLISDVNIGLSGNECEVTATVTATDDCGNDTTVETLITIDADGPDITIDPSVNAPGVCYDSIDAAEQAVLAATTITDNCGTAEDISIKVSSSVTDCMLRVRIDAVDKCGNQSSAAVTVRVDTHLPVVDIEELLLGFRGEVLAFQTPSCYATVADAEAAVLGVTRFSDNCSSAESLVTSVASSGNPCSLAVTSTAVDECLNENTDTVTVRVDQQPPTVTCAVATSMLWPPNHVMTNVGFTFTATDNCTGEPTIEIFVTSDETTASASGAGQTSPAPDAYILRDLDGNYAGILLRQERSSAGNGRVYQITVRATDECGNVGSCSANVFVPPNQNKLAVDDGQFFDATQVN